MARKSTMDLSMLADTDVKGCVFALRVVGEKIVAAVNSAVRYSLMHYLLQVTFL